MSDIFKEKLSSSDVAQLNRILRKIDMDLFLPLLLEMVLLNVKHAKENIVSMRWDWILVGHLQFNYNSQAQVQAQDATKKLNIQRDNSLALTFLVHFGPICALYSVMFFRKKRSAYSYTNEKCWTTNLFSIKRINYFSCAYPKAWLSWWTWFTSILFNNCFCSFNEYFELYLEEKGLEQIPGTENIPDDVKMKHLKAVWNAAVQLSDDFHKGSQSAAAWSLPALKFL